MQKPFFYYSSSFPQFLHEINISLIFSTYQAGKVIILGSSNGKTLQLFAKNFSHPMGIALKGNQMAIANKSKVDLFTNSIVLAKSFPPKPDNYDTLFVPQAAYFTGMADIHEIEWGNEGLWAVNTAFSCLCLMDEKFSFVPRWKPTFVSEISPEDRCHLNGLAMKEGKPAYVTLFDKTDTKEGWRNGNTETGMIMGVDDQRVIADKLPMPHSPVFHEHSLYFLLSATGEVMELNTITNNLKQITKLDNFVRGLSVFGNYLIVGASELRESSNSFRNFKISNKSYPSGIYVIDIQTGEQVAKLTFTDLIKEIFSVKVLTNVSKAALITENDEWAHKFIYAPDNMNYWVKQK